MNVGEGDTALEWDRREFALIGLEVGYTINDSNNPSCRLFRLLRVWCKGRQVAELLGRKGYRRIGAVTKTTACCGNDSFLFIRLNFSTHPQFSSSKRARGLWKLRSNSQRLLDALQHLHACLVVYYGWQGD